MINFNCHIIFLFTFNLSWPLIKMELLTTASSWILFLILFENICLLAGEFIPFILNISITWLDFYMLFGCFFPCLIFHYSFLVFFRFIIACILIVFYCQYYLLKSLFLKNLCGCSWVNNFIIL